MDKGFSYCPHCGSPHIDKEKEQKDYGFLGRQEDNKFNPGMKLPFGFNTIFNKLVKEMDKQFRELDREIGKDKERIRKPSRNPNSHVKQGGISINISSGAGTPVIKVKSFGNMPEFKEAEKQIKPTQRQVKQIRKPVFDEEKAKKLSKLPREEAESKVRRLSGKIVYEIELPEVKSEKDIIIQQLENSIEVKAFSKDKAYFKFLPVSLPLKKYKFSEGKLILELGEK